MTRFFPLAAAAAIAIAAPLATAGNAKFAEKAPALDNVTWLQGAPITSFEKDHVYVLDFWATWCGPCVAAIPHMTKLHNEHQGDLTIIGVAIWPSDGPNDDTAQFVKDQGDKMPYPVCADIDGKTAETYMDALDQRSIPTCMIIDKQGRVAWIGHPMGGMDAALEQVLADSYNLDAARSDFAKEWEANREDREMRAKAKAFSNNIKDALKSKDFEAAVAAIDHAYEWNPDWFANALLKKHELLAVEMDQPKQAAQFGAKLVNGTFTNQPRMLNGLAWTIATEYPEGKRDLNLALLAAKRADEITESSDPGIIDTLARIYFVQGDTDKAIKLQKKAIKIAEEQSPQFADQLRGALDEYNAAKSSM